MADRIRLTLSRNLHHPFLIDRAVLASLAKRAEHEPTKSHAAALTKHLESVLDKPMPDCPPEGISDPPTDFYNQITSISTLLPAAAVAWWIKPDPRWIELASRALRKLVAWEYWRGTSHLPLPADLTTGHVGADVALGYDLLFDQLDPALRQAVQNAVIRHCATFIAPENIDRCWWSWAHDGNWSFVTLGGMGAATLAILPERPEVLPSLETAAGHLQRSLDHIQPFGGWREGHTYMIYGFTNAQLLVDGLAGAGDARLQDHPGWTALDDFYFFSMLLPDRQIYFGDCGAQGGGGALLYRRAALTGRGDLQHFNDALGHGGPHAIVWRDPSVTPAQPSFDPPSRSFPEIGWTVFRSRWGDPDGVTLATKAGSVFGGHQHWDCGTFLLAAYGQELISEPGIGHYSRDYHSGRPLLKRTSAHNCLLFDDQEQATRDFRGGSVTQFLTRPSYDMVKMSLANAYEHPDLKLWNRYFFLLRPELVVMVDEVRAYAPRVGMPTKVESRLHTTAEVKLRPFDAVLHRPGAALMVRNLLPAVTPGLGDHYIAYSVNQHEGLTSRSPEQDAQLKFLSMRTDHARDPLMLVTVLLPGRSEAQVDATWKGVHTELRRRRRVEIFYQGQTLVLDWGNRRWELYWNVIPGRTPELVQATVGGGGG